MDNSEFTAMLSGFIQKAFDNEAEFLARFWNGKPDEELYELYMAGKSTRFVIICNNISTLGYSISTNDFIDWCDSFD